MAVAKDPDCHCHAHDQNCHNGATCYTCKPQVAENRRSIKEIWKLSSSSLKLWSRLFCPSCSMTKETNKATTDQLGKNQLSKNPQLAEARERTP